MDKIKENVNTGFIPKMKAFVAFLNRNTVQWHVQLLLGKAKYYSFTTQNHSDGRPLVILSGIFTKINRNKAPAKQSMLTTYVCMYVFNNNFIPLFF